MKTLIGAATIVMGVSFPELSFAGDASCVEQIPAKANEQQTGMVVGSVVGLVTGAYASGGDISITLFTTELGCNAGSALGKVYAQADNAALTLNGKLYAMIHTTPEQ
jgi:hypothetical protein